MKYGEFATWKWRGLTEGIKYFGRAPALGIVGLVVGTGGRGESATQSIRVTSREKGNLARYRPKPEINIRAIRCETRETVSTRHPFRVASSVHPVRGFTTEPTRERDCSCVWLLRLRISANSKSCRNYENLRRTRSEKTSAKGNSPR